MNQFKGFCGFGKFAKEKKERYDSKRKITLGSAFISKNERTLRNRLLTEYNDTKDIRLKEIIELINPLSNNIGQQIYLYQDCIMFKCFLNVLKIYKDKLELSMIGEGSKIFLKDRDLKKNLNYCLNQIEKNNLLNHAF